MSAIISYFRLYCVLFSGGLLGSLYNKKFEDCLPITIFSITIILYLFYIFNLLKMGLILTLAIICLIYAFVIYKIIKNPKETLNKILKNFLTPAFVVILISSFIILWIVWDNKVLLWDELRLWGAVPKTLFYEETIQLGTTSKIFTIMESYIPGISIFQYFAAKCFGEFTERNLFFIYYFINAVLLSTCCKNIIWKKWWHIPFYIIGIILIPMTLNSMYDLTYYNVLYIEPIMAILLCYLLINYFTYENNKFNYMLIVLGMIFLTLMKSTGILFAIILGILYIGKFKQKNNKKLINIINIIFPILITIGIFLSWNITQKVYNTTNMYTDNISVSDVVNLFTNHTENQKNTILDFKNNILNTKLLSLTFNSITEKSSLFNIIIIELILFTIIVCNSKNKKDKIKVILTYFIASGCFLIGLLFVYIFSLKQVASFPRYVSIITTSGIILLIYLLINDYYKKDVYIKEINIYIVFFLLLILPIKSKIEMSDYLKDKENTSNNVSNKITKNSKYELVFSKTACDSLSSTIYQHQIYFDRIKYGEKFKEETCIETEDELIDIINRNDYVAIISTSEEDNELFKNYLINGESYNVYHNDK